MELALDPHAPVTQPSQLTLVLRYLRRNPSLVVGVLLLLFLVGFGAIGSLLIDTSTRAYPLAAPPVQPPSAQYPLGTDRDGRDLLAVMVRGVLLTGAVGLMAGTVGIVVGTVVGFLAGYFGGWVDAVIRWLTEVLMTIPPLVLQVIVASTIVDKNKVTIFTMAGVASVLAWMGTARMVRAQVLSLRERAFVSMARLSGMGDLEIIFRELMPNMLPYLAASFVGAVMGAIGASFGLEALGLGPVREPTIGMTIRWAVYHLSLIHI
ncbi:MAG: ABC transporter permease, partial [Thermoflexales bacterium]|nr:ABC transporter permease [Thermoflexales bacterium]